MVFIENDRPDGLSLAHSSSKERSIHGETWWEGAMDWIFEEVEDEYQQLVEAQSGWRASENRLLIQEDIKIVNVFESLGLPLGSEREDFEKGSFLDEAMQLPATQRLLGLAQVNPIANQFLGLDWTQGRHTADCMRLTAQIFTKEAVRNDELFDQLAAEYQVELGDNELSLIEDRDLAKRVKIIQHLVEYQRLHDLFTLPFFGATHRMPYKDKPYHENDVLLGVLSGKSEYDEISQSYFEDEKTKSFYTKQNLERDLVRKIAEEALSSSSGLAQLLKGRTMEGRILSLDTIAYMFRGASELSGVFGRGENLPHHQRIKATYEGMTAVCAALKEGEPIEIAPSASGSISVSELIPSNLVRLDIDEGQPVFVFDPLGIYNLYLVHIASRLYFSGSPLVQGTERLLSKHFQDVSGGGLDGLIDHLLAHSEEGLLESDLTEAMPVVDLDHKSLTDPNSLPPEVKGWWYSHQKGEYPKKKRFVFKNIWDTLVDKNGVILPLRKACSRLFGVVKQLEELANAEPLYLRQQKSE